MSLQPQAIPPVPEATATTARAAFPRGNRYMAMRDELGSISTDQQFAAHFPPRDQPAEAPWRLALVLVFQFAESRSDEQAIAAMRARIDWKYALSPEFTATGFAPAGIRAFRDRRIAGSLELQLRDAMCARFTVLGRLKARGRQRPASTHVLAAVRALTRLQTVGETLRHALNVLAVATPDWLTPVLQADWHERCGPRFDAYRLPTAKDVPQALAAQIGADGRGLLQVVYAPAAPSWRRELPAVQTLRVVWLRQYHAVPSEAPMRGRASDALPPGSQSINMPYAPAARYGHKRTTEWTGYKVPLTESCDPDAPHCITHVLTSLAPGPDYAALEPIHTRGNTMINIRFDREACAVCARRSQCTRSARGPRELTVRPQAQHQALQAARKRQRTPAFRAAYAARAGIEGTLSEGLRVNDRRRSRYVGQAKTHRHHIRCAATINLRRFGAWATDVPHARTRTPAFVKLMAQAA